MKRTTKKKSRKPIELPLSSHRGLEPGARRFKMGKCNIIIGQSHLGWHMSISHEDRYPTWDEIADARYELIPNHVTMAFLLPPKEEYVNLHKHTFHLWQVA
jgi:hypothetical protein